MFNNPYLNRNYQAYQTQPYMQTINQPLVTPMPQNIVNNVSLQGKSVESIDVVKAMDIPLDGSISYFPLTDGSAIVSKQLLSDGTSKLIVYKPVEDNNKEIKFATIEDLNNAIDNIDISELQDLIDIKDDIKEIKKQLKMMKKGKDE